MPVRKIKINKIATILFALLITLSVVACLTFASFGGGEVALAANDSTGSSVNNATISGYDQMVETGASITLNANAVETAYAPDLAIAVAEARMESVITLSGDLWKAVQSGRITATLYANGFNTYTTVKGTAGQKEAGYVVKGALSGSGKFSTANTTYEDKALTEKTLLNAEDGNQIIIEYYATHTAIDSKNTLGELIAESSVEGKMEFVLALEFEEVVVTIASSAGGVVKDAKDESIDYTAGEKQISFGFGDSIKFTAIPDDGNYFMGWKNLSASENLPGTVLDFGYAVDIPSGESPAYSAQFQQITVAKQDEYIYSGTPTGPVVRAAAYTGVYYLSHNYTGTTVSGETVDFKSEGAQDIVSAPIRAGSFNYTCEFYYRVAVEGGYTKGERIGGVSIDFEIKKNTPIVTRGEDNASSVTLSFGDNLDDLDLSYSATNSIDTLVRLSGVLEVYLGEEKVDVSKLLPMSESGTDYTLRFTPTDLNNYNVLNTPFKIYVKDDIAGSGTNIEEGKRDYTISKQIATATDVQEGVQTNFASLTVPEGGELIKVSLRANMKDESGQFFFIGWRIGLSRDGSFSENSYDYTYLNSGKVNRGADGAIESISGLEYDYYLPHYSNLTDAERAKYTHAIFQAVFIMDTTCSANTINKPYVGSPSYTTPTFIPESAYYSFGHSTPLYYYADNKDVGVTGAPSAIGEHELRYNIINHAVDDTIVDVRVIKYNITIGVLVAEIDERNSIVNGGYDKSSGWARQMYYNLKVDGLLSKGAEAYYYSTDNGENWTKIVGTIADSTGCNLSFVTPEVVNDTQVRSYIFIATHETNGMSTILGGKEYKVVAGVATHTLAKIDTVNPSLTYVTETTGLNGAWTSSAVEYSALANYGGSGAVMEVCYVNKSSTFVMVDSNISIKKGDEQINTSNEAVNFSINTQYSGNVKIRIRTGTGLTFEVGNLYEVNIDMTPPVFSPFEKDHVATTAQGWIGENTQVTFTITNEGGSPLVKPTAKDIKGNTVDVVSVGGGKYMIVLSNSLEYVIVACDEAGNTRQATIQEKIDVEDVVYTFDEESFLGSEIVEEGEERWAKNGSKVILNVNMGASGARLRCSVDNGSYQPVTEFTGGEIGAITKSVTLEYEIPYSASAKTYAFQIETGTGEIINVPFGEVKFDIEAPVFTLLTDLSSYQGARWTSTAINAEFTAVDDQGAINSGIAEDGVSVDNGGSIDHKDGKYVLKIDKCTEFTITIKDRAGNFIEVIIQANVDTVSPTMTLKAYIGGGNPNDVEEEVDEPYEDENSNGIYDEGEAFTDKNNNGKRDTAEDFEEYDFENWITKEKYSEPWLRLEFTINLTASGSKLEYSNDNGNTWKALTPTYTPPKDEIESTISARTYIKDEQNKKYMFRLATGSGKYVLYESGKELFVKIDSTAPSLRSETFRVGNNANFDLKNVWVNQDGQYRIMLQDSLTGSGVNGSSVVLKEYPLDASDEAILKNEITAIDNTMSQSGDYFIFNMTEAKKYRLFFSDMAGNVYKGDIFIPHIDKTEGFSLTIRASKYNSSGIGNELTANDWLNANDYVLFIGTPTFSNGSGFGPSGGEMQFSIDGGVTYQSARTINGDEVSVIKNFANQYEMTVRAEQYYTYKFRLVTGAGVEYVYNTEFTVRKDNTSPQVSSTLTYQTGGEYLGEWTTKNLRFTVSVTVGASGGTLYYGIGETADSATWTAIEELPKNAGYINPIAYDLVSSTNGNYFFKVESGRPNVSVVTLDAHVVKLDNTAIAVESVATRVEDGIAVTSGSWVDGDTDMYPNVITIGESGVSAVYVKSNAGSGYGEYVEVTSANYIIELRENTTSLIAYVFKVVSQSGMEAETEEFVIGYDNVSPEFSYNLGGSKLPVGNLYQDWYISDIQISVMMANAVNSGYQIYYSYRDNVENALSSDWIAVQDSFILTDNAVQGGLDRYYTIKAVSGSGKEVVKDEVYLPIDTYLYKANVNCFVGDKKSDGAHEYAEVTGTGEYNRGSSVTLAITPNATYVFKSITEIVGEDAPSIIFDSAYDATATATESRVYVIGSKDVTLEVTFYKEVNVEYGVDVVEGVEVDASALLRQSLQSGEIKEVPVKATEDDFDAFFIPLYDIIAITYEKDGEVFNRANAIKEMGEYEINVASVNENYVIVNGTQRMVVVYFENNGTIIDPYLVYDLNDFYYIDEYMHYETGYDVLDPRAYIMENLPENERIDRRNAYFKQVADIVLTASFVPNGDVGEGYTNEFSGSYDGNGYTISYNPNSAFVTKGDFGLFLNISGGASITNLGVRYNVSVENANGANVGLLVANATTGGISSVYVIGNVYVANSKNVQVGGFAGSLQAGSLISESFADVTISVGNSGGYFGGFVGYANASYTANVYTISRITLSNCEKYSVTAPSGTEFAYAGAVLGYIENLEGAGNPPKQGNESYYLDSNISYDGSIEKGLSLGNRNTFGQYNSLRHAGANIDMFASNDETSASGVKIIELAHKTLTVKQLVNIRIVEIKANANMEGDGTTDSPFLVDSQEKLAYVETFPWAVFKQTADITLNEEQGEVVFADNIPFVGVYDGDNHVIVGASVESSTAVYGGIFGVVSGTIKNLKVINVAFNYGGDNELYAGGLVGVLEGGSIQNVVVTGTLEINSSAKVIYAGGLVGVMIDGNVDNSISMVNVTAHGVNVVIGGVVAQVQGKAYLQNVVNLSAISTRYEEKANVGSTLGSANSNEAVLQSVYHLVQNAYANDKIISSAIGYDSGATQEDVVAKTYQGIMETVVSIGVVQEVVGTLYPFEGKGTKLDPFQIDSYAKLELVGNYMYASFILTDNVVIGDWNDDGKLDFADDYDYDYEVIGKGATFTGSFDGDGYSIIGLSDSLFAVNAGAISDLTLNLNYKIYASENDIPEEDKVYDATTGKEYTSSKVARMGEEILFGALAKVNTASGSLIRLSVSGDIYVRTKGNTKVTLGGLVGLDMGGQIAASRVSANLSVRANQMVVGGIVGEIKYGDRALVQIATNRILIDSGIDLGGGVVIAGAFVGRIGVSSSYLPSYGTATEVIINGVSQGNTCYVGLSK